MIAAEAAQAAAQLTGKGPATGCSGTMAAAQDPVMQQQQAELQIEQAKIQQKAQEAQMDAQVDMQKGPNAAVSGGATPSSTEGNSGG